MRLNSHGRREDFKKFMFAKSSKFTLYSKISCNTVNFVIQQEPGTPLLWSVKIPSHMDAEFKPWEILMTEKGPELLPAQHAFNASGVIMFPKEHVAIYWLLQLLFFDAPWREEVEVLIYKKCAYCGRPLKSQKARSEGLGKSCSKIPTFVTLKEKEEWVSSRTLESKAQKTLCTIEGKSRA